MPSHTLSDGHSIPANSTVVFSFGAFTIPNGESFSNYTLTKSSTRDLQLTGTIAMGWGTPYTNTSYIGWTNGGTSSVKVRNNSGSAIETSVTLTFNTTNNYTAVTKGNKILVADRSQTGTTTTQGAIIKDSHFTSGTIATASAFNSSVLGL